MHEASDWWTGITISCSIEFGSKSDRILRAFPSDRILQAFPSDRILQAFLLSDRILRAFLLSAKRFRLRAFQISGPTVKVNGSKLRYEIKYT